MRVGIITAMLYEKYGLKWKTFFEELGTEIILSPKTKKAVLNRGLEVAENELCLPVKAFFGHTLSIIKKTDVLFMPRVASIDKDGNTCPKLMGLPDMIRCTLEDKGILKDTKILSPTVDYKEKRYWEGAFLETGKELGYELSKVKRAIDKANKVQKEFHVKLQQGYLPTEIFLNKPKQEKRNQDLTLGIIGHSYLLYDEYLNMNIIKEIRDKNIYVITPQIIPPQKMSKGVSALPKPSFWNYQKEIFNAAWFLSSRKLVDGLIHLPAFPCGPDSVIGEFIKKEAEKYGVPFTKISMDEHSGKAGVETRIEAFTDMIIRQKKKKKIKKIESLPQQTPSLKTTKMDHKDMIVSFPRMGKDTHLALQHLFKKMGVKSIPAPPTSEKTLRLGIKYGPETICLPLKLNIGNYIEALEKGANVLVHAGGCGPCRFGFYGALAELILKEELGFDFIFKVLEPPSSQGLQTFADFFRFFNPGKISRYILPITKGAVKKAHQVTGKKQIEILAIAPHDITLWKWVKEAYLKKQAFDFVVKESLEVRCYETIKGETTKTLKKARELIDKANSLDEIEEAKKDGLKLFLGIDKDYSRDVLRIGLVGELFILLEPFINFNIEEWLGNQRVLIERGVYVSDWIRPGRNNDVGGISYNKLEENAYPYLKYKVGGEGIATIGHTVLCAKHGYDGVIHMMPFTCMPETVAKQILSNVSKKENIPVLPLVIDEQTGKGGIETRLEAFIDLMKNRRQLVRGEELK